MRDLRRALFAEFLLRDRAPLASWPELAGGLQSEVIQTPAHLTGPILEQVWAKYGTGPSQTRRRYYGKPLTGSVGNIPYKDQPYR